MFKNKRFLRWFIAVGCASSLMLLILDLFIFQPSEAQAFPPLFACGHHHAEPCPDGSFGEVGGAWYWLRTPDEEKRVVMGLYNRYCIRCHGVDGRGVWDIPDVPDFTNTRWQASRSDGQLVRITLEGRGACMPPFRGTLSLEEGWGMARYLRTFVPGTEVSRPDLGQSEGPATAPQMQVPKAPGK